MVLREPTVSAGPVSLALGRLVERLTARIQAGEPVDWAAEAAAHPDLADDLAALRPTLEALGQLSRSGEARGVATPGGDEPVTGLLGDFRIAGELGRGGMGIVYEAEQVSLGRRVALKVLPLAATMDPRQLQRFHNEARAAACLHHPHIVPVYGVGCERGVHYYAMQMIEGRTLAEVIAEGRAGPRQRPVAESTSEREQHNDHGALTRPRSPETAPLAALSTKRDRTHYRTIAGLIADAADALEYAHAMGVVHRDVKPANLMLDAAGHLWVTDFGLAKLGTDAGLTMTGDLLGTLRYMSPEQALAKHGLVDHRTDVYSLGATLYELLTLQPAVSGNDKHAVLKHIAFEEPAPPRKLDRSIPAELETISLKALVKEPGERYSSAAEFADDLRRWLCDQAINAKPPGVREKVAKWVLRHSGVVTVTLAAASLGMCGLTISAALIALKERQTAAAENRAQANLRNALTALDRVCLRVAEQRYPTKTSIETADKELLGEVLAFYERFVRDNATDPTVRFELVKAYLRTGELRKKLGISGWKTVLDECTDLLTHLIAQDPNSPELRYALATCLSVSNRLDKALPIWDRLADEYPSKFEYRKGQVFVRTRYHGDLVLAHRALDLATFLVRDFPDEPDARFHLGECLNRRGTHEWKAGRLPEAEREYLSAQTILEKLVDEHPGVFEYSDMLGHNCMDLGETLGRLDRRREAESVLRRGVQLQQTLATRYASTPAVRLELGRTCGTLADVLLNDGRPDEAKQAAKMASDALESIQSVELHEKPPNLIGFWFHELGSIQARLGNSDEALRLSDLAVVRLRQALEVNPRDQGAMHRIRVVLAQVGRVWQERGDVAMAERAFRQAVAEADLFHADFRSHQAEITNPDFLASPLDARSDLAGFLLKNGRAAEAHLSHRELLAVAEGLITQYPRDYRPYCMLGYWLLYSPDPLLRDTARVPILAKRVAALCSDRLEESHDLAALFLAQVGIQMMSESRWESAEHYLTQCVTIREREQPDSWRTYSARSMLGEALLGQRSYADAEPLLVGGYEGLKRRALDIPSEIRPGRLKQALERLIRLLDATGQSEKAELRRKELRLIQSNDSMRPG